MPYQLGRFTAAALSLWDYVRAVLSPAMASYCSLSLSFPLPLPPVQLDIVTWKGVVCIFVGYLVASILIMVFYVSSCCVCVLCVCVCVCVLCVCVVCVCCVCVLCVCVYVCEGCAFHVTHAHNLLYACSLTVLQYGAGLARISRYSRMCVCIHVCVCVCVCVYL